MVYTHDRIRQFNMFRSNRNTTRVTVHILLTKKLIWCNKFMWLGYATTPYDDLGLSSWSGCMLGYFQCLIQLRLVCIFLFRNHSRNCLRRRTLRDTLNSWQAKLCMLTGNVKFPEICPSVIYHLISWQPFPRRPACSIFFRTTWLRVPVQYFWTQTNKEPVQPWEFTF